MIFAFQKMIAEKISAVHEGINIPVPEPIVSDGDEVNIFE